MISFIIPAYNAEKTIKRAVDSILNQKEKTNIKFEIIIVDDGSKDKIKDVIYTNYSIEIQTKEVKYIHTENGGVSHARNIGVNNALGEYIIFVDSDDYVSETMLQDIEKYVNQNIDLIKWNPIFVNEDETEIRREKAITFDITTGEDGFNKLFGKDNLISCLWNYAIKKDLMLEFPESRYHEDFATMPLMVLAAKTMVATDLYEYNYVQTESSIMRGDNSDKQLQKLKDILINYDELLTCIDNMKLKKRTKDNAKIFATNSLLVILPELEEDNKQYFMKELSNRKVSKYIKIRSIKQFVKKLILKSKGI